MNSWGGEVVVNESNNSISFSLSNWTVLKLCSHLVREPVTQVKYDLGSKVFLKSDRNCLWVTEKMQWLWSSRVAHQSLEVKKVLWVSQVTQHHPAHGLSFRWTCCPHGASTGRKVSGRPSWGTSRMTLHHGCSSIARAHLCTTCYEART